MHFSFNKGGASRLSAQARQEPSSLDARAGDTDLSDAQLAEVYGGGTGNGLGSRLGNRLDDELDNGLGGGVSGEVGSTSHSAGFHRRFDDFEGLPFAGAGLFGLLFGPLFGPLL